jgi:methyl-accepting chemotaxis protein
MNKPERAARLWGRGSIRLRLALAFCALIALLAATAAVGAWRLAQQSEVVNDLAQVHLRLERVVGNWLSNTRANAVRATVLTRSDDPDLKRLLTPTMEATTKRINLLQAEVESLLDTPRARELFAEVGARRATYLASRKKVLETKQTDQEAAMRLMEAEMLPAIDRYVDSIQAMSEHFSAEVGRNAQEATASAVQGRNMLLALCAVGVLLAIAAAWLITRSISGSVREAVSAAQRIADGDLSVQVQRRGSDELGQLLHALGDMSDRLRALVAEVAEGARTVADTSTQIAQGNADLSQRTEEQASTLEETASSMEELTSTVSLNAENARQAKQLATTAAAEAQDGGAVVGRVVDTMQGIQQSSRKISEIIGVIDGIAFQTNILALNAAVEAARAGDQGRGFAVVASEVRSLAQRSAQAAKEIKTLIVDSVQQVDAGTAHAAEAGRKMGDIVRSVEQVSNLIAEIAAASAEQSSGIEQVNTAVTQMDGVVQQNASLVEEAAAATESMKGQAAVLLQSVSRFRLGGEAQAQGKPQVQAKPQAEARRPAAPLPIRVRPAAPAPALPAWATQPAAKPAQGEWQEF